MVEIGKLAETIEKKDKSLDTNNRVDGRTLIFMLRNNKKQYELKVDKVIKDIFQKGTSKQAEDFRKRSTETYEEYSKKLGNIEKQLNTLSESENNAYEQIMKQFEKYVSNFEDNLASIQLNGPTQEELKGVERLKYVENMMYDNLGIDKNTYENRWGGQFTKGILDEVILGNAELVNLVYEEGLGVVFEMVKQLLSWNGLKEIAHQLRVSIGDLFVGNAYEKGRSFGQLGLVTTGGGLALAGGKKLIKIGKNISKEGLASATSKLGAGLIVETSEFVNTLKTLPEYARKILEGILASIGKKEGILMAGRYIEGGELIMINKFIKAFEVNHKILGNEQYAYMSSTATYMLMRHHNVLPGDLDIAVNPKNILSFVDKITNEIKVNPKIEEATFIELLGNGKTEIISINDMDRIKKVAEEGKLNISYKIEGLEVELFPETNGTGLSNIGYMDKAIISHKIKKGGKTILEVPTLDNKGVAQGYVLNYLNEFGNSTIEGIESKLSGGANLGSIKMKDASRINNIYILLKDAGLIENPEQLLKFIDDTVKEYDKLPSKGPYVADAINTNNVLQGVEKLKKSIGKFYDELNSKIERNNINTLKELPSFKQFTEKLKTNRIAIFKYYQEYLENGSKLSINKTEIMIQKTEKLLKESLKNISKIDDFAYYYEINNTFEYIQEIRNNLHLKRQ